MSSEKFDTDDDTSPGANTTRRKLMAAGAASWATVGLAGCSGNAQEETTTTTEPEPTNYVVTDDMAVGSEGVPGGHDFLSSCSPSRKFTPGMQAIWYVGVYDPASGEQLTDEELGEEGVEIHFTNRDWDPVALGWAGDDEEHPADEWGGSIVLPTDAEPGEVKYEVQLANPPENANFKSVGIAASSFTVLEESELDLVVSNYTYAVSEPEGSGGFVNSCTPQWAFAPGMRMVFGANIYDANTGEEPGPDVINSVTVTFPDGQFEDLEMEWMGDAEEHADKFWEKGFTVPEDAEPGTVAYEMVVDAGDNITFDTSDGTLTDSFTVVG